MDGTQDDPNERKEQDRQSGKYSDDIGLREGAGNIVEQG